MKTFKYREVSGRKHFFGIRQGYLGRHYPQPVAK